MVENLPSIVPAMPNRPPDAISALRRHLDRSLFKAAPETPSRLSRGQLAVLVACLLIVATLLQLFRIGPGIALNSLWAEDGPIYLQGALQHGFWTDIWTSYGGYLVFVPRLIGLAASVLPLRDAAAVVAILSTLIVAFSGLVVWVASAAHLRDPWLRGTLAALAVLAPTAAGESVASGAYAPWFMLLPVFWLLIWRPRSTRGALLGGFFVLMTGLSTAGIWFFAPLVALRALAIRDRRDGILVGAWALGSAIQVPALLLHNEKQIEPQWSHDIWTAYLQRVLDGAAFGERLGGGAWGVLGWPLLIGLMALAGTGLYLGLRRADAGTRWLAAIALPTSVVMFIVAAYQRAVGPAMTWPTGTHFGAAGRYTIVPALLLVSVALLLVEGTAHRRVSLRPWLVGVAVTGLIVGMAVSFNVRDSSARGTPSWTDSLDAARAECRTRNVAAVSVAISPPPFSLALPCAELEAG